MTSCSFIPSLSFKAKKRAEKHDPRIHSMKVKKSNFTQEFKAKKKKKNSKKTCRKTEQREVTENPKSRLGSKACRK